MKGRIQGSGHRYFQDLRQRGMVLVSILNTGIVGIEYTVFEANISSARALRRTFGFSSVFIFHESYLREEQENRIFVLPLGAVERRGGEWVDNRNFRTEQGSTSQRD